MKYAIFGAIGFVAVAGPAFGNFISYTDTGGTGSSGNVTYVTLGGSGSLLNYADGAATGATLTITQPAGYEAPEVDSTDVRPSVPNVGTPAYAIFGPVAAPNLNESGHIWYGGAGAGNQNSRARVTLTGLAPGQTYSIALFGNRGGDTTGPRYLVTEIGGADSFVNTSSVNVPVLPSAATTTVPFASGNNTATGYIAQYSNIVAGVDGTFYVDAYGGAGGDPANKWYLNAVQVTGTEIPEPATLGVLAMAGIAAVRRRRR